MKKSILFVFFILMSINLVELSFAKCDLNVSLLNQDPYPAVPGDYVKIVFVVSGITSTDCGKVSLELIENYPLKFDPGFNPVRIQDSGTFSKDFSPNWIVPYKIRIDENAIDGDAEIEVAYSVKNSDVKVIKKFNLRIEETKTDFDVFIKNYDFSTKKMTFEILNKGKGDASSVIVKIPKQENVKIIGGNTNIIGDLDSKDYTTFDFYLFPSNEKIKLSLEYLDKIGEKRILEKEVYFEAENFEHTKQSKTSQYKIYIIIAVLVVVFILWRIFKKRKKF